MSIHPQGGEVTDDQRPKAGLDVCKLHLDVCVDTTEQRVANDVNGGNELIAIFKRANVDQVVVEATWTANVV